mgnify:FL=1
MIVTEIRLGNYISAILFAIFGALLGYFIGKLTCFG